MKRNAVRNERNSATVLWTVCATLVSTITPSVAIAQGQIFNSVSQFPITIDGSFSGGVAGGMIQGEWSDIAPAAFISPNTANGPLIPVAFGDPRANSLLYAGIAVEVQGGVNDFYLMYDFLPRTNPVFAPGEFVANVSFPVTLNGLGDNTPITVMFSGGTNPGTFNVGIDANGDLRTDFSAESIGMEAAVGFGPSALSATDHMLIELGMPLRIPAGFGTPGGPFPGNGINPETGLYDEDEAFWGSSSATNTGISPSSAAIFQILPNGSTVITPLSLNNVPEPSTLVLLGAGVMSGAVALRRRKRA